MLMHKPDQAVRQAWHVYRCDYPFTGGTHANRCEAGGAPLFTTSAPPPDLYVASFPKFACVKPTSHRRGKRCGVLS
jgi:hypothetical protein